MESSSSVNINEKNKNDLIQFILEHLHKELNKIEHQIFYTPDGNDSKYDYKLTFQSFAEKFKKQNQSIISDNFFGFYNSMINCFSCRSTIHNIKSYKILSFNIQEVLNFKKCFSNILTIYDCFDFFVRSDDKNVIFCDKCGKETKSIINNCLLIAPYILIINLDRSNCKNVNFIFEEYLNLKKFLFYDSSPYYYELIGVIGCANSNEGSFIAYCKNNNNCKLYKYNDEIVNEFSFDEINKESLVYTLFFSYIEV